MSERRCLFVLPPDLGSALFAWPALGSLAASGRLLTIFGSEEQLAIFDPSLLQWRLRDHPERLGIPLSLVRGIADAGALERGGFHEAVFVEPTRRDVSLARSAGISELWGYRSHLLGPRLDHAVETPKAETHAFDRLRGVTDAMDVPWDPQPLHRPGTWARMGKERLQKARLRPGDAPVFGIYPGNRDSVGGDVWPADLFEELIRRLRQADSGRQFVFIAEDPDLWLTVLLHERTGKIHPVVGPDLHLDGLAAVLSTLDLLVASDSALLHLAALVDTPTVGLFRKDAALYAPRGPEHRRLDGRPFKKLSVDAVLALVEATLAGGSAESKSP